MKPRRSVVAARMIAERTGVSRVMRDRRLRRTKDARVRKRELAEQLS